MSRPLAIDLFCGLGGWSEGLLAEGYDVVGFDIERHEYGDHRYPAQLVVQDVLTLHGSQFRDAALIVASPPCQAYSYMAMPWKLAKAKAAAIRADTSGQMLADLNRLFDACFRIQAQASLAAGRHIPMVVENVRGAQPWVGRARWMFGSFALWGDVPALMPITYQASKVAGFRFDGSGGSFQTASVKSAAIPHIRDGHRSTRHLTNPTEHKVPGIDFNNHAQTGQTSPGFNVTAAQRYRADHEAGIKARSPGHYTKPGSGPDWFDQGPAAYSSNSNSRKAASAMIAKIPLELARHVAAIYRPS